MIGSARLAASGSRHRDVHYLIFGPDGFLYVGLGDGGSGGDPGNRAQNPSELLGRMLRVDVNVSDSDPIGYLVPSSNPFVGGPTARVLKSGASA